MLNTILRRPREAHLADEPISFHDLAERALDHDIRSAARPRGDWQ
jgi:hypothetical protein